MAAASPRGQSRRSRQTTAAMGDGDSRARGERASSSSGRHPFGTSCARRGLTARATARRAAPTGLAPSGSGRASCVARPAARSERFGYSALWLAAAGGPDARVDGVDRFEEHVRTARAFADDAGLADRLDLRVGEAADRLDALAGPYDLVHDDAWFASEPPYLERLLALVARGSRTLRASFPRMR
jgi:hypothetical protein